MKVTEEINQRLVPLLMYYGTKENDGSRVTRPSGNVFK